jgi:hypothetical protein
MVTKNERFVVEENRLTGKATLVHSLASWLILLVLAVPLIGCAGKTRPTTPEAARVELGRRGIDYSPERFVQSAKEGNSNIIELFLGRWNGSRCEERFRKDRLDSGSRYGL